MNACGLIVATVLACAALQGRAQALPAPPPARVIEAPGTSLPLDVRLTDSDGRQVRLADFFGDGRPALLLFGYYQCPQLCGLLMQGVLESLYEAHANDARILGVSIDPQDTPSSARARRERDLAYARFLAQGQGEGLPDIHLLVAEPQVLRQLTRAAGFEFTASDAPSDDARFAHPATVLILTPAGRISRYLMGIRFDGAQMVGAVDDASAGKVAGLGERIALLCAHLDPRWGQHSGTVLWTLRVLGTLSAVGLLSWCWRRRHAPSETAR